MLSGLVCNFTEDTHKSLASSSDGTHVAKEIETRRPHRLRYFVVSVFFFFNKVHLVKLCLFNVKEQNPVEGILLSPYLGTDTGKGRSLFSTMFRSLEWLQACV